MASTLLIVILVYGKKESTVNLRLLYDLLPDGHGGYSHHILAPQTSLPDAVGGVMICSLSQVFITPP